VHKRPERLDPHIIRKIAEAHEVVPLMRIKNDPNHDAAPFGRIQGFDHRAVSERIGGKVDREFRAFDHRGVDRVESLFGGKVNFLGGGAEGETRCQEKQKRRP
jgi:hypothetical protein